MKKKLTIFAVTVAMMLVFSVITFAEEGGAGSEPAWNLWSLLNLENLDLGRLFSILISTFATIFRVIGIGA